MKILSKLFEAPEKKVGTFINDRRLGKRYDIPLKLNYLDPSTNSQGESLTKNISRFGLRFQVNTNIPRGTMLDLKIEDPNSHSFISSKAKVLWVEKFITGDDAGGAIYEVGVRLSRKRLY